MARADDLPGDIGDDTGGDGKADPGSGTAKLLVGGRQRGNAHHLLRQVDERPAAVARVDRRRCLDHIRERRTRRPPFGRLEHRPPDRGDDPVGRAAGQAEGVAHGKHDVTHLQLRRVSEVRWHEMRGPGDLDDRQIVWWIAAREPGGQWRHRAGQDDLEGRGGADDMRIRHDVTGRVVNHAGAEAGRRLDLHDRGPHPADHVNVRLLQRDTAASRRGRCRARPRRRRGPAGARRARGHQDQRQRPRRGPDSMGGPAGSPAEQPGALMFRPSRHV